MAIQITLPTDSLTFNVGEVSEYNSVFLVKPGGIYVFYNEEGECLYVGKSVNLRSRIRTRLNKSPFKDEIDSITIYFSSSEAERDIYETYAINEFGAKYNRDKVSKPLPLRSNVDMIRDLTYDIEELEIRRADIIYEINSLDSSYGKPGKKRQMNNFTGEESRTYCDYLDYVEWFRAEKESEYNEEKDELVKELRFVDEEISENKRKIKQLSEKIRV